MTTLPDRVESGHLIASKLINNLLAKIREMDAKIDALAGGEVGVFMPDVFGMTLINARNLLAQPPYNLGIRTVLDVTGDLVNPDLIAEQQRIVIGQVPPPKSRVVAGSDVDIVIAAAIAEGGTTPAQIPVIDRFWPDPAFTGEKVAILGQNFDEDHTLNTVMFNGVQAEAPLTGNSVALIVNVPEIPTPPVGEDAVPVAVTVNVPNRDPAISVVTVMGPRSPKILAVYRSGNEIPPGGAVARGQQIRILGHNFGDDLNAVSISVEQVSFGDYQLLEPDTVSDIELKVTIPGGLFSVGGPADVEIGASTIKVVVNPSDPYRRRQSTGFDINITL